MDNDFLALTGKELEDFRNKLLSQAVNSDEVTLQRIGWEYQKQLAEIFGRYNLIIDTKCTNKVN